MQGNDPPDLVFEVEGLGCWAVEVTELQQYFDQNDEPSERTTIEQSLLRICDNVRAKISNELQRTYWLNIHGPIAYRSIRKIERRAIDYVRSGKTEEEVLDDLGRARIKTFPSPPRFVVTVGLDQSVHGGAESHQLRTSMSTIGAHSSESSRRNCKDLRPSQCTNVESCSSGTLTTSETQ
jgi:hypothetical protein